MLFYKGQFSDEYYKNDAAFVAFSETAKVMIPFGTLTTSQEVAASFLKMSDWRSQMGSRDVNYTSALELIHESVLNYSNYRPKIVVMISNNPVQ